MERSEMDIFGFLCNWKISIAALSFSAIAKNAFFCLRTLWTFQSKSSKIDPDTVEIEVSFLGSRTFHRRSMRRHVPVLSDLDLRPTEKTVRRKYDITGHGCMLNLKKSFFENYEKHFSAPTI